MNDNYRQLLLIPHIRIQNANALSSPYTIGFPAMTAWMGAVHALQRNLHAKQTVKPDFTSVAVISHEFDLQTYKGLGDYVNSLIIAKRPSFTKKELTKFNAGKPPTFIEEARCHLEVSLIIEYTGVDKDDDKVFLDNIYHQMNAGFKIAGGDILEFDFPKVMKIKEGALDELRKLIRNVMPGYALIERRELMTEAMNAGQDAIDAMIDFLAVHHGCEQDDDKKITWTSKRKTAGWIVPIATGFHGITEPGQAENQRDPNTPHRFAESVVTLGEFKMPHSISSLDEILWRYHVDLDNNLYLCQQDSNI